MKNENQNSNTIENVFYFSMLSSFQEKVIGTILLDLREFVEERKSDVRKESLTDKDLMLSGLIPAIELGNYFDLIDDLFGFGIGEESERKLTNELYNLEDKKVDVQCFDFNEQKFVKIIQFPVFKEFFLRFLF